MQIKNDLIGHIACALLLLAPMAGAQEIAEFKGQGAALCVAAGELLAQEPKADANLHEGVLAWRQVLHVMEATDEQRQAAIESARDSLRPKPAMAKMMWKSACATRDMQVKYIAVHGSVDRSHKNLGEEPGAPMSDEAATRLSLNASCSVAADLFLQPPATPVLRAAFRNVTPAAPDATALRAIQQHSRAEIDGTAGSAIGKTLVVEYLRYIYSSALRGNAPQGVVDRVSRLLQDRCQPATGSTTPAQ